MKHYFNVMLFSIQEPNILCQYDVTSFLKVQIKKQKQKPETIFCSILPFYVA